MGFRCFRSSACRMRCGVASAAIAAAAACGLTTHMVVTHRAWTAFSDFQRDAGLAPYAALLARQPGALQGGSPSPDYLYTCGNGESPGWL
jgi:hypothetical protein